MNNSLSIQGFRDNKKEAVAPVISIGSVINLNKKVMEKISKTETKKNLPQFYTKPIFKTKKYDFL